MASSVLLSKQLLRNSIIRSTTNALVKTNSSRTLLSAANSRFYHHQNSKSILNDQVGLTNSLLFMINLFFFFRKNKPRMQIPNETFILQNMF